jgi:hypothetical protein
MSTTSRPNFFIILDIDPSQSWSDQLFVETLDRKRSEWTKGSKNPKNRAKYSSYMELVPQIKVVMTDPEKRKQEGDEARRKESEALQEQREKLRASIGLVASKGYITEDEIKSVAKQYEKHLTEADVRAELKRQGIEIKSTLTKSEGLESYLEPSRFNRIKDDLEIFSKKDLYDFLEATVQTRTEDLRRRANDIYKQNQAKGAKTAQVTASSNLAGDAQDIFKDDMTRERYDRTIARDKFDSALRVRVREVVNASSERIIRAKQFEFLLSIARQEGLDIDRASDFIRESAMELKAAVEVSGQETIKQKLVCTSPSCRAVNDPSYNACSSCGTPLKITCPNCATVSSVNYRACPHCSFPVGNLSNVRSLLSDSQHLIKMKDYGNALECLELASREWSMIPPRSLEDSLTQEINQRLQQAKGFKTQYDRLLTDLRTAIDERRFYTARTVSRQVEAEFGFSDLKHEQDQIETALRQAETDVLSVRQAEARGGDVVEQYQSILWKCADCKAALDALAKIPPEPPSRLSAQVGNHMVRLSWTASSTRNIRYTVIRKVGSPPVSAKDGEQLTISPGTVYEDTKPTIGVPLFYAVYTNRESILSAIAAQLNQPVLMTEEVSDVVTQVSDRQVSLSWNVPPHAIDVAVFYSTAQQPDTKTGQRIEAINKSKISSTGLENGRTYYYTIYTLFKDHEGKTISSHGTSCRAIPEEPPSIIKTLQIELDQSTSQQQLRLSWQAPNKGEGAILISSQSPVLSKGSILPEGSLRSCGKLELSKSNKPEIFISIRDNENFYFTPIVLFQNTAFVGETVHYVNIEDVKNFRCLKQKDELHLQWDWCRNSQIVEVAYSSSGFSANQTESGVMRTRLTKTEYELLGYYPIKNLTENDYYITVHNVLTENGKSLISSAMSSSARCHISMSGDIHITYSIKRKRSLLKKKLTIEIKAVGKGELPNLVLVCKQRGAPLKREDGDVLLKIPKTIIVGQQSLEFQLEGRPGSYGKLFLEDNNLYKVSGGHIRIDHPALDNLETSL